MAKQENETAAKQQEAIAEYLDRLCGPLKSLPAARREEMRREVHQHLQMLIAGQENAPDAVQKALAQFGEPEKVGRTLARQARWDAIRLSWRAMRWTKRLGLLCLFLVGFWGTAITVEFCRWMQWGHSLTAWFVVGPMLPLLMGFWWGTRDFPARRGYLFVGLLSLALVAFLPVPGQFARADMDSIGIMDLSGWVRFTYVILWLWISCSVCGVLRILLAPPPAKSDVTTS